MKKTTIVCLLIIVISFISCKKYEDGPYISFRSFKSKISGTWKATKQVCDGNEYLNIWTLTFILSNDSKSPEGKFKTYTKYLSDGSNAEEIFEGIWEVTNKKKEIILTSTMITYNYGDGWGSQNIHFIDNLEIKRLTKDELWLNRNSNGHQYHFEFKKE